MAVDPTCSTCGQGESYFMAIQRDGMLRKLDTDAKATYPTCLIIIQFSTQQGAFELCRGAGAGRRQLVPLQVGSSGYDVQSVMNSNLKKGQLMTHPIWPFKSN